jgi:hypothetical protein
MFRGVSYNRFTTAQVRTALEAKVVAVRDKVSVRRQRIEKIAVDNGITPEAMSDLVVQYMQDQQKGRSKMTYTVSNSPQGSTPGSNETLIPAGVIVNLVTEKELITNEVAEIKRMELILRNLRETLPALSEAGELVQRPVVHTLDDSDIEYLGL